MDWVEQHGVVRSAELRHRGVSEYQLARAVSSGQLKRVRHGWVAHPTADPQLVFAAVNGLILSCITQAARLGLWVKNQTTPHYAVQRRGSVKRPLGSKLHYCTPVLPRTPYTLADSIENTLVIVASCEPFEDAVATWDSALNKKLVERHTLEKLQLTARVRTVLETAVPFADSGLETYLRLRLRWLREPLRQQIWLYGHRVDMLIGDRLVIQIDGRHHVGAQRTSDIEHDAKLVLRGYTVIRVGYEQVMHRWHEVQDVIMRAVAQGLHRAH